MSNGHTSGFGSGFVGIIFAVLGVLVALAAIAFGIGLLLKSTVLMVVLGFALPAATASFLRSSKRDSFLHGLAGASSALVASLAVRLFGVFAGGLLGVVLGAIAYFVALVYASKYIPKKKK